jgi:hypothetical protein
MAFRVLEVITALHSSYEGYVEENRIAGFLFENSLLSYIILQAGPSTKKSLIEAETAAQWLQCDTV